MRLSTLLLLLLFAASCKPDIEPIMQEARQALGNGDHKKAADLLTKVLEIDEKNADALNMRSVAYISLDEMAQAAADLDRAIAINPNNHKYYFNRGNLKRSLNQAMAAIEDYDRALALDSGSYMVWLNKGASLAGIEKDEEAMACFESAIRNGGANDARIPLFKGQIFLHESEIDKAIEAFQASIALNASLPEAYFFLGEAYMKAEKADQACQQFNQAKALGFEEANHAIEEHCQQ